jgi:thioredoxin reductase (NADPH)
MKTYDVIVVGAGPAGLTAAANASFRGLCCLVVEKNDFPGGLPVLLYPDKIIRDHPGFPVGILGKELSRMLFMQAKNAGAEIRCGEEALKIEKKGVDIIEVKTTQDVYQSKRVILCTGIFNVPKKLEILKDSTSTNVHYKLESPEIFKNKRTIIVGGGDNAFDTAVQFSELTKNITILVKNRYAKAKENTIKLAEKLGIKISYNTEIVKVSENVTGKIDRIETNNIDTGEKKVVDVDELFISIGFEPVKIFLENNGFELQKDMSLNVDRNLQTNIAGVFAAGDVTGEVRLIVTACAEGIVAAVHAFETIKKPYWLH